MGGQAENVLDVSSHVQLFQHLVALIQDEMFDVLQIEGFVSRQGEDAAGSADDDGRILMMAKLQKQN